MSFGLLEWVGRENRGSKRWKRKSKSKKSLLPWPLAKTFTAPHKLRHVNITWFDIYFPVPRTPRVSFQTTPPKMILDIRSRSDTGKHSFYGVYDNSPQVAAVLGFCRDGKNIEREAIAIMDESGDENRTQDFRRYLARAGLYDNVPCSSAMAELAESIASPNPNAINLVAKTPAVEPRTAKHEASESLSSLIPDANKTVSDLVDVWRTTSVSVGKHSLHLFYQSKNVVYVFEQTCIDGCLLNCSVESLCTIKPDVKKL